MRRTKKIVIAVVASITFALPASAMARQTYVECDNAHSPDYPTVSAHPSLCNLGLAQSYYDVQPVPQKSFVGLALRGLRWNGWGNYEATAHGLACDVRANGSAVSGTCDHVTVHVYRPEAILPAGGAVIYQLLRVSHRSSRTESYSYAYWYRPGTDY